MDLLEKAELSVSNLLKDRLSPEYTYHNFAHTQKVVAYTRELTGALQVPEKDALALELAAWFHDVGYVEGAPGHEEKSVLFFTQFALKNELDQDLISEVTGLIRATNLSLQPKTPNEEIIRDADCAHFGSVDFALVSEQLRQELCNTGIKSLTSRQWLEGNRVAFTTWHQFYTSYARKNWEPQRQKNLEEVNRKLEKMEKEELSAKTKKDKKSERSVETLFRVTLNNHTQLSQIADSKANILLSVNAIIISISLSTLIPKLDSPGNAHLVIPTFIMLTSSVISIIFAILSTRPKVHRYVFNKADIEKRSVNLLFFGNFNEIPMNDYVSAMKEMLQDSSYLHESLIKDLYLLGKVLDRKYKLLRITYNFFMFGIIISVVAFAIGFHRI